MLTDLAGYNVYRGTASGNYGTTPINGTTLIESSYYSDTSVTQGTTYYYIVKAVDSSNNEGPASAQKSVTPVADDLAPKAPTLSITEKETELVLYWTPNYEADLKGYKVLRKTATTTYSAIATNLTDEWYIDNTALAGETYYYVVKAVDLGNHVSAPSNQVSGMIAQGDIWILWPTSYEPATIDFGDQTVQKATAGLTTHETTGRSV
jgi:fibronectin type 3 domain-containing protein